MKSTKSYLSIILRLPLFLIVFLFIFTYFNSFFASLGCEIRIMTLLLAFVSSGGGGFWLEYILLERSVSHALQSHIKISFNGNKIRKLARIFLLVALIFLSISIFLTFVVTQSIIAFILGIISLILISTSKNSFYEPIWSDNELEKKWLF